MAQAQTQPQEKTANVDPKEFYGYLFEVDKSPTPVLNALLRGIANYIVRKSYSVTHTPSFMLIIFADKECGK